VKESAGFQRRAMPKEVEQAVESESAATSSEAGPRSRWRLRRAVVATLGLFVFLLGLVSTGAFVSSIAIRRHLQDGESALRAGRANLADGELPAAEESFALARAGFQDAAQEVSGLWLQAFGWLPFAGRTTDALDAIAETGMGVAEAGLGLVETIDRLPDDISSLGPAGGRLPVERYRELAEAVAEARDTVGEAVETIRNSPRSLLLGSVGEVRRRAQNEVESLHSTLASGAAILDGLPAFLGADGPRTYFFAAQNPAELRGTGGVMGAYSILTVEDGRLEFSPFRPVQSLPIPALDVSTSPSQEFADNYDEFRTERRFWLAINMTPDFPTAAKAILNAYEVAVGERLDGVLTADPFALRALLQVTGPATVRGLDHVVGARDVVEFTTNGAYRLYDDQATRKRVLGAVAQDVLGQFLLQAGTTPEDLRVLARAAAEGHLLAYSDDPQVQPGFAGVGVGGAFTRPADHDFLSIVENSSGGTKVDFYQDRDVDYRVELWSDGSGQGTAGVRLTNEAPTSGEPRYVIGPRPGFADAGEGRQLVSRSPLLS
jgi:hypothetical protein